jgi:hypothetical protein
VLFGVVFMPVTANHLATFQSGGIDTGLLRSLLPLLTDPEKRMEPQVTIT